MNLRCFSSRAFVSHKPFLTDEGSRAKTSHVHRLKFKLFAFVSHKLFVTDKGSRAETSQVHRLCYDKVCSLLSTIAQLKHSNEPDYYKRILDIFLIPQIPKWWIKMVKLSCTGHAKARKKMRKWWNYCWGSKSQREYQVMVVIISW